MTDQTTVEPPKGPCWKTTEWIAERVELLKQIYLSGSAAWIMRQINGQTGSSFTRNSIISKIHRLNLERPTKEPKPKRDRSANGHDTALLNNFGKKRSRFDKFHQPPQVIPDRPVELPFLNVKFMDLQENQCRFVRGGDVEGTEKLFCGQPVQEDSSFCPFCHRICYMPGTAWSGRTEKQQADYAKFVTGMFRRHYLKRHRP